MLLLTLRETYALNKLSSFKNLRRKGGKFYHRPAWAAKGPATPLPTTPLVKKLHKVLPDPLQQELKQRTFARYRSMQCGVNRGGGLSRRIFVKNTY